MAKRVIFIVDAVTIFVTSMLEGLTKEGFACEALLLSDMTADKLTSADAVEILWLTDDLTANYESLLFIRNHYVRHRRKLFLFGYSSQIDEATDYLPEAIVAEVLERPMAADEIADELVRFSRSKPGEGGTLSSAKKHILVVDDSGAMLRTIKGWLEPRYRVSVVNSGANAISFLSTQHPDLILLDYEMPVCSGPMLLQMIRSEDDTRDIPVFFLTGKDDRVSVENALHLQPEGYLLKSVKPAAIVQRIDNFFTTGL